MKKYFKFGLFVFAFLSIVIIWSTTRPAPEYIQDMVLNNKNDYDTMARLYHNDYQTHNAGIVAYAWSSCLTYDHKIILTDEESLSMQKVTDSYYLDKNSWDRVYVYDTFVTFGNINGRESLVYSVEDKRPSYINSPDEKDKHVAVKKITDHWYYVYDFY